MVVLQIEHKVNSFDGWKKAFDSDPIGRKKSGVRRYRIYRPVNKADYVIIDLEFDTMNHAENALEELKKLWVNVEGSVIFKPQTRIIEVVEETEI